MKNRGGPQINYPSNVNHQKRNIIKNSGQSYAESSHSGDREGYDLGHSQKVSNTFSKLVLRHLVVILNSFHSNRKTL